MARLEPPIPFGKGDPERTGGEEMVVSVVSTSRGVCDAVISRAKSCACMCSARIASVFLPMAARPKVSEVQFRGKLGWSGGKRWQGVNGAPEFDPYFLSVLRNRHLCENGLTCASFIALWARCSDNALLHFQYSAYLIFPQYPHVAV